MAPPVRLGPDEEEMSGTQRFVCRPITQMTSCRPILTDGATRARVSALRA